MDIFARLNAFVAEVVISKPPGLPDDPTGADTIATIMNIVFGIIGGISLIIVTLAGFKYVTSRGDTGSVAKAKDTILYAAIGLVIAIFGAAFVQFIVKKAAA
jgi:uncharacterized membrane protein YidH (DUF202 family)